MVREIVCDSWSEFKDGLSEAERQLSMPGEALWYRGASNETHTLTPSLMRLTQGLTEADHDRFEQDAFFEFQARSAELRHLNLTDWDYLFYARHYRLPTRVLDWTDTLATALYFASENWAADGTVDAAVWVMNPYALNAESCDVREIILPKYLGVDSDYDFWDFGELLTATGDWGWKGPVAIYPTQINDRVRAQRGWFTIHGEDRSPLDRQYPELLVKLRLKAGCASEIRELLRIAGLNRFSIYPDLENLALWISADRVAWAAERLASGPERDGSRLAGNHRGTGRLPRSAR